jgi:hypothetical protein
MNSTSVTNVKLGLFVALSVASTLMLTSCQSAPNPRNKPMVEDVPTMARSNGELRKRILVLPFLDATPVHETTGAAGSTTASLLGSRMAEESRHTLIQQLGASEGVVIVDIKDLPQDLAKFLKGQEFDLGEIAKLAAGLGVTAILEGKITDIKTKRLGDQVGVFRQVKSDHIATVRARLIGAKSGRTLMDETRIAHVEATQTLVGSRPTGESTQEISQDPHLAQESCNKAFHALLKQLIQTLEKMSWEGRIAMVTAEKIYLNSGRLTGIQVGDILRVREAGDAIYDPKSGELIGTAPGRVKGTLEIISYFGRDGSVAVVHSGSGFQENDTVELY